jgi:tetratricopeptide (TPR) repeat protein
MNNALVSVSVPWSIKCALAPLPARRNNTVMSKIVRLLNTVPRILAAFLLVASLALSLPAAAGEAEDQSRLLELFAALKVAPNENVANSIAQQIWAVWIRPSDELLANRLEAAIAARERGGEVSLQMLDQLIRDFPDFAEAWNQRATLHYMMGNYPASLSDIAKTLELEPRHFGALSGRALIYLEQGQEAPAMRDIRSGLAIHPFLFDRSLFPNLLEDVTRT